MILNICPECWPIVSAGYAVYLDALNDVLLLGSCTACGATIQRHLELGENEETSAVADHIRYIKQHYSSKS